jgi:hypothetical protein
MISTRSLIISTFGIIISSSAFADCRTVPVDFAIASNPTLSTGGVTDGSSCPHRFTSKRLTYTESSIEKQAKNGKVIKENLTSFKYTPNKGFKGKDTYTLKLCGYNASNQSGCATINYEIEVK